VIKLRKNDAYEYEPFGQYTSRASNSWGHFTSVEFVDKDALKWVVLQFDI